MEIIPDPYHVALLTLPFLVAMISLHLILWRPLLEYLDAREEASSKALHEAHELESASSEQLAKIEERLGRARVQVADLRGAARSRAVAREGEIVAAARSRAEEKVTEAVNQIASAKAEASGSLRTSADELSRQIATQVLGRAIKGS